MPVNSIHAATAAAASAARSHTAQKANAHAFSGALARASSTSAANTPDSVLDAKKAPKGEKAAPVKGHSYADITHGPRNGMYINTSGNKRHGDAFVLVNKAGVEYHIYGTGADREVIAINRADDKDDE